MRVQFSVISMWIVLLLGMVVVPRVLSEVVTLEYVPQTKPQPLKGMETRWNPSGTFTWNWLVVSQVMRDMDQFDWSGFEQFLNKNSRRGLHSIVRPIVDDTTTPSFVPPFLTRIPGATTIGELGRVVPVYSHPATRAALVRFVEAFGARYDGDPRLGFIEVGLLGQWGEGWAPRGHAEPTTEVTIETHDAVHDAYRRSFKKTHLLLPGPTTNAMDTRFGFHNEAFAFWKDTERFYTRLMNSTTDSLNRWRQSPITGRVHPEYSMNDRTKGLFFDHITESRMVGWIEREHTSCLRFPSGNRLPTDLRDRFLKASQRAGYEFSVTRFELRRTDALCTVSVTITNSGVAPFYYSWPFQLAVLEDGAAVKTRSTPWDVTRILPGEGAVVYETTLDAGEPPSSGGTLLLRITNPIPNGAPIRFANKEQDIDVDEWLSLRTQGEGK